MTDRGETTLPAMTVQTPGNVQRLTRLSVADAPFCSTGTARVKVTRGGTETWVEMPIKSVDLEDVEMQVRHLLPAVPTERWRDPKSRQWVTVRDIASTDYEQKQNAYARALARTWALMALDVDVVDRDGKVVWSADNETRNLDDAVRALKDMGFVDAQFADLLRQVRELTSDAEERLVED